ncbi:MAG: hypothetical protein ACTSXY_12385 [Promethearchaeota archaeon]
MKNGIAYPLAPEVIEIIERQRKKYIKLIGVRVSQAKFTGIIAPRLKNSFKNIKMNLKPPKKLRRKRRWN